MKNNLLNLSAVIGCIMIASVFAACSESIDNPASAVDDKQWNVTDEIMDKSISPGDDFYMYCTGGYWNNTVVDEANPFKMELGGQIESELQKRIYALNLPSLTKVYADSANTDAETIKAQKDKLQSAIDRVDALTTKEEAWKLVAELYKEGYRTPLDMITFAINGKTAVTLSVYDDKDYMMVQYLNKKSLSWRLANDPELLARVRPLKSAATRGIDNEKWPMLVTFFNTLQIPLDDVYAVDECPPAVYFGEAEEQANLMLKLQDYSVEEWKQHLKEPLEEDAIFFDDDAAAAVSTTRGNAVKNFLSRFLKYELSKAFAQAYVTAELKQQMTAFAEELRQTFIDRIQRCDWLSDGSKQNAIEKMNNMIFNIGAPDEWFDEGIADLSHEPTLFDDILALRRTMLNLQRKLTGMNLKRASFHMVILDMTLCVNNASYILTGNYMNILPAFILPPAYNPEVNDAHNYAIMAIWGHEMIHGFDTNGAHFDKNGDLGSLWVSEDDAKRFQKRANQLIDYYSSMDIWPLETGLKNDGAYTLDENVADLGGFLLAYDSYVKHLVSQGFTGQQLLLQKQRFYEAYAYYRSGKWTADFALKCTGDPARPEEKDEHSLDRERVNGVVANTDDWYRFFDVKPTDKLYLAPEDRVRIW